VCVSTVSSPPGNDRTPQQVLSLQKALHPGSSGAQVLTLHREASDPLGPLASNLVPPPLPLEDQSPGRKYKSVQHML
jgi:hypothetical protein